MFENTFFTFFFKIPKNVSKKRVFLNDVKKRRKRYQSSVQCLLHLESITSLAYTTVRSETTSNYIYIGAYNII